MDPVRWVGSHWAAWKAADRLCRCELNKNTERYAAETNCDTEGP